MQTIRVVRMMIVAGAVMCSTWHVAAQETDHTPETKADVPTLHSFHTVIYTLWHTAWPNKDTAMLTSLLPDIERGASEVARAELPGILRDKKPAWDQEVASLQGIVAEYATAVREKNGAELFDAAERLHAQFERLIRTIRPALKELDEFHAVLYMLYHHYVPEHNQAAIRTSADSLGVTMERLNNASLPARLKSKERAFVAARSRLSKSVKAFVHAVRKDRQKKIKAALNTMHADYQRVERVFD